MTTTDVAIRLLGPVAVLADGATRPVHGLRRCAVLAALALQPGETVSSDRLVDIVWGDTAPRTAADALHHHVSYVRRALGRRADLVAGSGGYVLKLADTTTDVEAAEQLIRQADQCFDVHQCKALLHAAVARWEGPPLGNLTALAWFGIQAQRLDQLLLHAQQLLIDSRMELGEHQQVLPELERLCRQNPLNEQLHGQLMLALYRCGRQADALAAYHELRRNLDDELGVGPGPGLRDLETAILRQDSELDPVPPTESVAPPTQAWVTPAQLPRPVPAFRGRLRELWQLHGHLPALGGEHSTPPEATTISLVTGTAGVGKTALAIHWAHQIKRRFPDGQLYVNLRGFDPSGSVMYPSEAVRGLLDTLGVPASRIPATFQAQVTLYRSVLAGKRVLIVVDNARDEQQVRPLLPGAPGCLVVVTSRNQLPGLVAAEGAHPLTLRRPSVADARQILAGRLGTDRVEAEPQAVDEIIAQCVRLPLALAVAAGRAAMDRQSPLSRLAAQLRDTTTAPLDCFDNADPATNVRAVFSWSYRILSEPAARLFRLLSLCPGPDVAVPAAASVACLPPSAVRPLLAELVRAGVLTETSPDRFGFHDLLRAYAAELAHANDSEQERRAATHRILDHYLHSAYAATLLLRPARDPITLPAPAPGVTPQPLADLDAALTWFQAEHSVLLATVSRPVDSFDRHTWQLAWTLLSYLTTRGYWRDNELVQQAGLHAAERIGDRLGLAYAHRGLAKTHGQLGRFADAQSHHEMALHLFEQAGDVVETANSHLNLGITADRQGDIHRALTHVENAHRAYQSVGCTSGQAYAANAIGWYHGQLGNHRRGLPYCQEAFDIFLDIGDLDAAAMTWDSLGALHFGIGDPEQGDHCYRQAITLYRRLGDRYYEANTYANLIHCHTQTSNHDAARQARQQAIAILNDLEPDAASQIRARLEPTPTATRVGSTG